MSAAVPRSFADRLSGYGARLDAPVPLVVEGRLTRMVGLTLEATGCQAAVGDRCLLVPSRGASSEAEVVGFSGERLLLMPTGNLHGLEPATRVIPTIRSGSVPVGEGISTTRFIEAGISIRPSRLSSSVAPSRPQAR